PCGPHEPECADDRRVGHAEDEVGPLAAQSGANGLAEVAAVVGGAVVELRALVCRRPDAHDPDAVPLLLVRQLVAVQMPGDDGDVVVAGQGLAELCQQLGRRLDAGPVVLVQDEDPTARAHRALTLTHAPHRVRATCASCSRAQRTGPPTRSEAPSWSRASSSRGSPRTVTTSRWGHRRWRTSPDGPRGASGARPTDERE